MNTLLVIFNTVRQNAIDYIKRQGGWAKLSPGAWLIRTNKASTQLRDELINIAPGDEIIVFNVTGDGWATSFSDEVSNWMKENI